MKSKEKILSLVSCGALLAMLLMPVKTHAALQANGSEATPKTINDWLSSVREMEAQGGTLGLTGSADLTGNDSNPNNLDIHMQKNTEYGAMAILSASSYGKSTPVHETANGLQTTTGNKSGVYITLNGEWVAAGVTSISVANFKEAKARYKNIYTTAESSVKSGDAMTETKNWHTTGGTWKWLSAISGRDASTSGMRRAVNGSLFSYDGYNQYNSGGNDGDSCFNKKWYSRAVIVLGNGF